MKAWLSPLLLVKRGIDILLSLAFLILLLPVFFLIALILFLEDSKSPVLFFQPRIGRFGRVFILCKFRTMTETFPEREATMFEPGSTFYEEWSKKQKLQKDPRATRIGAYLRKYSLDELPQLVNVLRGEMSLIGPRPIVAQEVKKYGSYFKDYCRMRPGLTGLWQVSGRNDTTYPERVRLDHLYVTCWSPLLDLKIALKTIPTVLSGKGAY